MAYSIVIRTRGNSDKRHSPVETVGEDRKEYGRYGTCDVGGNGHELGVCDSRI